MKNDHPFEADCDSAPEIPANPPTLNNMGGLNHETPANIGESELLENWCGFDWLTLTYWVEWGAIWETDNKNAPLQLRALLDEYQLTAMERGEAVEAVKLGEVLIHPGGGKIAKKYCRFKLELDSAIILIADQPKYAGDWPNVKIEISGERCLCFHGGALEAYRHAVGFLEDVLGATIHKERVSRCDLCADFPEIGMDEFIKPAMSRHWTCRSRLFHPYLKPGSTSLYWGNGALQLRVYDKLGEMRESALRGAPAKYEHMKLKRWNGEEPVKAVRVEFQLRRDSLKGFGITDVDSLVSSHGDLIKYLTGAGATLRRWDVKSAQYKEKKNARWFRFLTDVPDSDHPENNIPLPMWEFVQRVFVERFLCPEVLEEIQPELSDIETLLKQAFGVLETAAANRGYDIPNRQTAAPSKFHFDSWFDFERWIVVMLRSIAVQKPGWAIPKKEAVEYDELYELWLMDRFKKKDCEWVLTGEELNQVKQHEREYAALLDAGRLADAQALRLEFINQTGINPADV